MYMKSLLFSSAVMIFFTSCATVRVVKSKPGRGGTLALQKGLFGDPVEIIAEKVMNNNCPNGFKVVEEGEVIVGKRIVTRAKEETKGSVYSNKSSKKIGSETEEMNQKEWHLKYKCKRRNHN